MNNFDRKCLYAISDGWWGMNDHDYKKLSTGKGNVCSLCSAKGKTRCKPQHMVAKVLGIIAMFGLEGGKK